MPDIAVIIPTFNRAKLIAAALDSILTQTILTQNITIEVAIVDDGSTDNTHDILQPYLHQYAPTSAHPVTMRYTRLQKQGVVVARNTALDQTSAPLVAFLDSDDYWAPTKLQLQLAGLNTPPTFNPPTSNSTTSPSNATAPASTPVLPGLSHTAFRYINQSNHFTDAGTQRPDNPCAGWCLDKLIEEDLVIFSSVLVRRSILSAIAKTEPHQQLFDPRWTNAQDYDLLLRAAKITPFHYVPEPVTLYRLHDSHGAMGNLPRAFGFHARVQIDFVTRHGQSLGWPPDRGHHAAASFLYQRAQSLFWQRQLTTALQLCDTACQLQLDTGPWQSKFSQLRRQASKPRWLYLLKDRLDRLLHR